MQIPAPKGTNVVKRRRRPAYASIRSSQSMYGNRIRRTFRLLPIVASLTLLGACQSQQRTTPISDDHDIKLSKPTLGEPVRSAKATSEPEPRISDLPREDDDQRWLRVEAIRDGADGGWATGAFDPARNKIRISTEKIVRFSIDVSRIAIDWSQLVVIRIDGVTNELRRRNYNVLHFVKSGRGTWEIIEP